MTVGTAFAQEKATTVAGAADIHLDKDELWSIDTELDSMEMSEVFGGSPILKNPGFLR